MHLDEEVGEPGRLLGRLLLPLLDRVVALHDDGDEHVAVLYTHMHRWRPWGVTRDAVPEQSWF